MEIGKKTTGINMQIDISCGNYDKQQQQQQNAEEKSNTIKTTKTRAIRAAITGSEKRIRIFPHYNEISVFFQNAIHIYIMLIWISFLLLWL